jgi:hypothetical protein
MPELTDRPRQNSGSFASLLTSFTSGKHANSWDDSALADDVTTISYEQALRSHQRVRTSEAEPALAAANDTRPTVQQPRPGPSSDHTVAKRKTASITIRVTDTEQIQLHERAAAAKLSVSAYLRSCIFEAESLRAQVKEALAQMRAGSHSADQPKAPAPTWRSRLIPRWSRNQASV